MSDRQDELYRQAGEQFAPAIARLAATMERDSERARDLEQDIHAELWRSFSRFRGDSALKTWVFRVAHNVAADHVGRDARIPASADVDVDELELSAVHGDAEGEAAQRHALARAREMIRKLPMIDAQIVFLWLEGESAKEIAEVVGLDANAVGMRIHRAKNRLAKAFEAPAAPSPSPTPTQPQESA